MALIDRITRLFQADMHAVLDRIEDPEQALRLAMRDMDDEIRALEDKRRLTEDAAKVVARRLAALDGDIAGVDGEIDVAFDHARDDLARAIIRRKLVLEAERRSLQAEAQRLADRGEDIGDTLTAYEAALDDLRREMAQYVDTRSRDRQPPQALSSASCTVDDNDVEIAFLREQQARAAS